MNNKREEDLPFIESANFYDFLYKNKKYDEEVSYLTTILPSPEANKKVLSLGCGTGNYEIILAQKGYLIDGIDISSEMIKIANNKKSILEKKIRNRVNFFSSDILNLSGEIKYFCGIALFHVLNYFTSDTNINQVISKISSLLESGSYFVFDSWHAPWFYTNEPKDSILELTQSDNRKIIREGEVTHYKDNNIVEINYKFNVDGEIPYKFSEKHTLKYFDPEYLENIFVKNGFRLRDIYDGFTNNKATTTTRSALYVFQKNTVF